MNLDIIAKAVVVTKVEICCTCVVSTVLTYHTMFTIYKQ